MKINGAREGTRTPTIISREILNLLCLPFHHPGTERDLDSKEKRRRCQWNAWRQINNISR